MQTVATRTIGDTPYRVLTNEAGFWHLVQEGRCVADINPKDVVKGRPALQSDSRVDPQAVFWFLHVYSRHVSSSPTEEGPSFWEVLDK